MVHVKVVVHVAAQAALASTDEHRALAESTTGLLTRLKALAAARATLAGGSSHPPELRSGAPLNSAGTVWRSPRSTADRASASRSWRAPPVTGLAPVIEPAYYGNRAVTIAGGTSEITRNTIAERIPGLPREPLLK